MRVIGLAGKMRVGKTTLAGFLTQELPGIWGLASFVDAMREDLARHFGVQPEVLKTKEWKAGLHPMWGVRLAGRKIMQQYGALKRVENPAYWADRLRERLRKAQVAGLSGVVVDDVRYANEAAMLLRDFGAEQYYLEPYETWAGHDDHASENELSADSEIDQGGNRWVKPFRRLTPVYGGLVAEALRIAGKDSRSTFVTRWTETQPPGFALGEDTGDSAVPE